MLKKKAIYLCLAHMSEADLEQKYIKEAFDTNWVVPLGPNVNAFEDSLEAFVGQDEKVVALSSGTAAVHLALLACGVGAGDEVCVQSFTFCASSHPITYLGAKPIFIDSEKDSWNMDPKLLEFAIKDRIAKTGKKPKAIVPVALYGMPYNISHIMEIANRYEIPVIEDAAEGFGSRWKGQVLGTFGKFGVLSFNGNKMITTSGGGALICNGASSQPSPEGKGDFEVSYKGKDFGIHTADPMCYGILKEFTKENRKNPTETESILWNVLKANGIGYKFRQQHTIEDFIVDFYCNEKKLTIELDGGYHNTPEQMKSDAERTTRLQELGYVEIRFTNEEVAGDIERVRQIIKNFCEALPSAKETVPSDVVSSADLKNLIMWYATQARDAYPYYQHTAIGYNYRMSNICAGIGRGQMTVANDHIAHHKHVQALYRELLKEVKGVTLHEAPSVDYDSNFWLCTALLDPDVRIQGQENAYKEIVRTAVGGAAGVVHAVDTAVTNCQPNANVEALRVFMLNKKIEARPLWKPMHKQPVYCEGSRLTMHNVQFDCWEGPKMAAYVNGVSESFFKIGFCLPAGPMVSDDDVRYIVDSIKEGIVDF